MFPRPGMIPRPGMTAVALAAAMLVAAVPGEAARSLLRWDRQGLARGEIWRLVTGHLVHLDARHALLNVLGLLLVAALWRRTFSAAQWCVIVLAGLVAIDAGLWFLDPGLQWYVGASGVLHAAMAAGITREAAGGDRLALALAVAGLVKLGWERFGGPWPWMSEGLAVVTSAHLYGVAAGAIAGLFIYWANKVTFDP